MSRQSEPSDATFITGRQMERISVKNEVCHGKPCIAGTRIMVEQVLDLLEAGYDFSGIRTEYFPDLEDEDIRACIRFARQLVQNEEVHFAEEQLAG
jgi:uncharacterized protein (DUF433 family)